MMMQKVGVFYNRNRRLLPLATTIILFIAAYIVGALYLPGMRDMQVFFNLFNQTSYLLVAVIGEAIVVISGGIDLSVGGIVALTTTASAALLQTGWNPLAVMLLMLVMGTMMGAVMGYFITYLKVQPFIATLAGMWIGRGLAYFISNDSIAITNPLYVQLQQTKIYIPFLSDPATKTGDYIIPAVVVALIIFIIANYLAHYTRFGRTVYSIGGNNGANEISARLMGLPVNRTKWLAYTFNGFCSALAGILLSIYTSSGHGAYGNNMELTVIAAVVIGGMALTGGEGYVFGALFGTLITILIQMMIQFQGTLISWWTLIVVGLITLFFIGIQSLIANLKIGGATSVRTRRLGWRWLAGAAAGAVVVIALVFFVFGGAGGGGGGTITPEEARCKLQAFRQDDAAQLVNEGAVIVYERNGGPNCIDELYAIYADGRIVGDNGTTQIEKDVTAQDITNLMTFITNQDWFTDNMYSTSHTPCSVCYTYYTTVVSDGQTKTVEAVDGGTDAPSEYWLITGQFSTILPSFTTK